ncbi:MAG: hypothetical protein H7Y88_06315 [Phycisphaerales bacterium]|nr:hypothetical protein [Phycisphaerales bacterium]
MVTNPGFPGTSFLLDSSAPDAFMAGFENAIATGSGSARVFNGLGVEIGAADGSGDTLIATWPVDAVPGDGAMPRVVVGWNSIPAPGVVAMTALGCIAALRRRRL